MTQKLKRIEGDDLQKVDLYVPIALIVFPEAPCRLVCRLIHEYPDEFDRRHALAHPNNLTGRAGKPQDVANAFLWLASPAGS